MSQGLDACLTDRVAQTPDRLAFRCSGQSLTYAELKARATGVAQTLLRSSVKPGDRVGIVMTKGLEMPVAIHAIWLAGAGFVPLDTTSPLARMTQIVGECGIDVLLTAPRSEKLAKALAAETGAKVLTLDVSEPAAENIRLTPVANSPDDIAYIIFTSGSTGRPKGIVHTHASGRAFAEMWTRLYNVTADDVCFCTVPLHFDFSLADFIAIPISGASTELVPEMVMSFPASLAKLLASSGGTIWSTVPHALIQLCERGATEAHDLSSLRLVIYGGEPLAPGKLSLIRDTFGDIGIANSYGPAEVNQVTIYHVPADQPLDRPIPIGDPTDHAELDVDEEGTLLVHTEAMMRGYWGRPDLNETAFVERGGKRYYVTGDLAEQGDEGLWRFIGREDRQVKLRGYRVELDEVERILSSHPSVSEAAVVMSPDRLSLIAHVTPRSGATLDSKEVVAHAALHLPPYAVPQKLTIREDFMRTTTGKIDRRALAEETT